MYPTISLDRVDILNAEPLLTIMYMLCDRMDNWENVLSRHIWEFLSIKELFCLISISHYFENELLSNCKVLKRIFLFINNGLHVINVVYKRKLITTNEYNYWNTRYQNMLNKYVIKHLHRPAFKMDLRVS